MEYINQVETLVIEDVSPAPRALLDYLKKESTTFDRSTAECMVLTRSVSQPGTRELVDGSGWWILAKFSGRNDAFRFVANCTAGDYEYRVVSIWQSESRNYVFDDGPDDNLPKAGVEFEMRDIGYYRDGV